MIVQSISSMNELKGMLHDSGSALVIIDCYATWCKPCTMVAPKIEDMARRLASRGIRFCKVDVDQCNTIADKLNVSALPTFVFMKNGIEVDRVRGADLSKIESTIEKHLSAVNRR